MGFRTGRGRLKITSFEAGTNASTASGSDVTVVQRFRSPHDDPFFYVVASVQLIALSLLGLRVRTASLNDSLRTVGALLATLVCQIVIVPLVCLRPYVRICRTTAASGLCIEIVRFGRKELILCAW